MSVENTFARRNESVDLVCVHAECPLLGRPTGRTSCAVCGGSTRSRLEPDLVIPAPKPRGRQVSSGGYGGRLW